ncbi:hypothetical protein NS506_03035 [Nocardia seriolae]|uniref:Uncharacterized protein n=1 Tax=Nocardia seriolae TaxID=37332 RepID=A0ABC8ASW3_9NOCA|nr:hypothetical protein NS506_03035 [Nocardia seriolae]
MGKAGAISCVCWSGAGVGPEVLCGLVDSLGARRIVRDRSSEMQGSAPGTVEFPDARWILIVQYCKEIRPCTHWRVPLHSELLRPLGRR